MNTPGPVPPGRQEIFSALFEYSPIRELRITSGPGNLKSIATPSSASASPDHLTPLTSRRNDAPDGPPVRMNRAERSNTAFVIEIPPLLGSPSEKSATWLLLPPPPIHVNVPPL